MVTLVIEKKNRDTFFRLVNGKADIKIPLLNLDSKNSGNEVIVEVIGR